MTLELFPTLALNEPCTEPLAPGAVVLRGFALPDQDRLQSAIKDVTARAPFRHLVTPGGYRMSVAMTNCGPLGWVADRSGYRYDPMDPDSAKPWPPMPASFMDLAARAAAAADFAGFIPDACLINRYEPGARLSLHQDKDERDGRQPIVSVSLGVPAIFVLGGLQRSDQPVRVPLQHGDVVVFGGPSRMRHHGILALKHAQHPMFGEQRVNLTFRRAR